MAPSQLPRHGWVGCGSEAPKPHPGDDASAAAAAVIIGGPALYLVGNALFKRDLWGYVPVYRLVAIGAIVALFPLALVAPLLALLASATSVLVAMAAWDTLAALASDRPSTEAEQ